MVRISIVSSCLEECSHRESASSTVQNFRTLADKFVSRHPRKCRDLLDITFLYGYNSDSKTFSVRMCAVGSGTLLLNMGSRYSEWLGKRRPNAKKKKKENCFTAGPARKPCRRHGSDKMPRERKSRSLQPHLLAPRLELNWCFKHKCWRPSVKQYKGSSLDILDGRINYSRYVEGKE